MRAYRGFMASSTDIGPHHEIEIKLDAAQDFALPDLQVLPGVVDVRDGGVHQLEAVYLDSPDLRLIRHGTTFRRRTGGDDAGWHLKLPAGGKTRIEVRRELGGEGDAVPPALLGLVRAQLRGGPVQPVAKITTRRSVRRLLGADDVVLAEVADDTVVAEAMGEELTTSSWREIEVELVAGDEGLLAGASAALIEAGARPSGAPSKLRRVLAHRLAALRLPDLVAATSEAEQVKEQTKRATKKNRKKHHQKRAEKQAQRHAPRTAGEVVVQYLTLNVAALIAEDPRVRIDEPEGVHQMRVACRRLRTALATFRPLFDQQITEPLRAELKWLATLLGVARDAEVMRQRLRREIAEQPADLVVGPVRRRVDLELGEALRGGHAAVVEALDGERYLALITALESFVTDPPYREPGRAPAPPVLRARVRKACRRVRTAIAGLNDDGGDPGGLDHRVHEVRIAAKRARYAAEAVRPVVGRPAARVASAMEEIQETLGDHQDSVVERQWLRDLGMRAFLNGENGFTFGRLHALAEARGRQDRERFAEVWSGTRELIGAWPG
jgi:CHAD domain-containing protein